MCEVIERHGKTINNDHEVIKQGILPQQFELIATAVMGNYMGEVIRIPFIMGWSPDLMPCMGFCKYEDDCQVSMQGRLASSSNSLKKFILIPTEIELGWRRQGIEQGIWETFEGAHISRVEGILNKICPSCYWTTRIICSTLAWVVNDHISIDWLTYESYLKSDGDVKDITKSHLAYPLITSAVKKAMYSFCVHVQWICQWPWWTYSWEWWDWLSEHSNQAYYIEVSTWNK